jgi:hypothetical protein
VPTADTQQCGVTPRCALTQLQPPQLSALAPKFVLTGAAAMLSEAATFPIGVVAFGLRLCSVLRLARCVLLTLRGHAQTP